jgi:hypothetical protein
MTDAERRAWDELRSTVRRLREDPHAPSRPIDRLGIMEKTLRNISASVRLGIPPDQIDLHRLAAHALAWRIETSA